ncbi:unannotated protein [freshwater metagenome]|uniref:Unannotated protein n=1 Tax=freshwater metagenome TaxID=449393 RepID=A0A6J7JP47_9ZZZZ
MSGSSSHRPSDHVDSEEITSPDIGFRGWLRWFWRQLTSMRTALFLLLLLATAAVPGSIYPQRSADPNGVTLYFSNQPDLAPWLDRFQFFDVYSSAWFSAIYILLFVSLIGCVLPRSLVHARAMVAAPPDPPKTFTRLKAKASFEGSTTTLDEAFAELKARRYRVVRDGKTVSAERGYLRETGNLVFHISLIGLLVAVAVGGGLSYSGQRVLIEGETLVNNLGSYDSFAPGTFFTKDSLTPFTLKLKKFEAVFDLQAVNVGTPTDFRASVVSRVGVNGKPKTSVIRVNEPLELPGANVYLTGNGYAPVLTFRDANGDVSFSGPVIYLPQDANYTSLGVIKVPDASPKQFGVLSFYYPTVAKLKSGALTSAFPGNVNPAITMSVYVGNLGLDNGMPTNVFSLQVHGLKQVAGGKKHPKVELTKEGQTVELPENLGTVTWDSTKRYASLDIDYNPAQLWIFLFAMLALAGLIVSLLVPRRRVWVRKISGGFEVGALAKGDDARLEQTVIDLKAKLATKVSKKVQK